MLKSSFLLIAVCAAWAQGSMEPGKSIGKISARGDLIVMTLDEGALGHANLFDLAGKTVQFAPDGGGYRVSTGPLRWDADFGGESAGAVSLHNFEFPFSGKNWNSFNVGVTGTIIFGSGFTMARFDQLQEAARNLVNTTPAIAVFDKPRMNGKRYVKELADRVVITWNISEPSGNIQDFTWVPTVNRFQAVLHKDGAIEFSYEQVAAKDAIVGLYPLLPASAERELGTIRGAGQNVTLSAVDGTFLKVTVETPGTPTPAEGAVYRVAFGDREQVVWSIRGLTGGRGGARFVASGPGVGRGMKVSGNSLSIQGILPASLRAFDQVRVKVGSLPAQNVKLTGLRSPEVDLSALKKEDGPFPVLYESFHYLSLPNPRDMTCTVIQTLGDKFDMLAYYSDFRVDNQEAGTPSNGPLGGNVTGIGQVQRGLASYCSEGRFQWQFIQPVYVGSNQMQERPPENATGKENSRDIAYYERQLGERSADGKMAGYNYAMSQIGHEMGHRWSAFVSAKVNGEIVVLGPTHWARGLQAPVAFPYMRPTEASAMGGGVWQDNHDGTFTQLDDDYYVPATGWSYLDLYLMGLIGPSEVPDFFILRNLSPVGRDTNGHPIFKADRTKVTIQDVIAVEGPRMPDVEHSQRAFNTGFVVVVEHGMTPSKELIERTNAIREKWIEYWSVTTGRRSTMTAAPK